MALNNNVEGNSQVQQRLAQLAEPTIYNAPGASDNPRVARWVQTQVQIYVNSRTEGRPGAPRYEDRSVGEIVTLVQNRGLILPDGAQITIAGLIQWLRRADEEVAIRFGDLPEVVRKLVYEWYYDSLGVQGIHQQPAVTRTNRLLRSEALPIFYNRCTFQMCFESLRRHIDHVKYPRPPVKLTVDSGKFLRSVQPDRLRSIVRMDLNLLVQRRDTVQLNVLFRLRNNTGQWSIDYTLTNRTTEPYMEVVLQSPIKEDIERVLSNMATRRVKGDWRTWAGWNRADMTSLARLFDRLAVDVGAL